MTGRPKEPHKREAILSAGVVLAREVGLWNVTVTEIAARCDMKRTTVIYHCGSAKDIKDAIWQRMAVHSP